MTLKTMIVAAIVAITAPSAFAQATMTQTQFRDHVIAKAKASDSSIVPEITGPLSFKFGDGGIVNLDSGYAEYAADPSQLPDITRRWLQGLSMLSDGVQPSASDLKRHLVPLVRNRLYVDNAPADITPDKMIAWRPLGGDLVVLLMADYPTMRGSVTNGMLAQANLGADEAWRTAQTNAVAAMGELQIGSYGPDGPVAVTAKSGLATAILADPTVCNAKGMFAGAYVFVADRDTFLIGRSSDPDSIGPFWAFVRNAAAENDYASITPLTCKDDKLVEAAIPPNP